ncbi:MAG: sigma 54-interacting transcriptional regulator [Magnetococcales bacterium]|nr:sigma 54-interacting transcriptional regulator [Magnetococcales bacterium]
MSAAASLASPALEFSHLLDSFHVPTILVDAEFRIQASNQAYRDTFGQDITPGRHHCYEISHSYRKPCDEEGESCPLRQCLGSGQRQRVMHVHQSPEGPEFVDVELRPIPNTLGSPRFFLEILTPIRVASAVPTASGMVGVSPAFRDMLDQVRRVAPSRTAVLLTGESGTGKEVVARAIHDSSPRSNGPFVPVECSGLTESLFETELFGHERGAFTGAHEKKTGLVELAHHGTLFLDEIGDVPLTLQVKLLRLLETNTFRKVGGVSPLHSDFRLVCATNRDLQEMLEHGLFRLDLYYRISVFPIRLPPLRQRKEDLPMLVDSLLRRMEEDRSIGISEEALTCLSRYGFPGNIRELHNILERACLLLDGDTIQPDNLPDICVIPQEQSAGEPILFPHDRILPMEEVERQYLRHALDIGPADKAELAGLLGMSQRTLYRKIKELNL